MKSMVETRINSHQSWTHPIKCNKTPINQAGQPARPAHCPPRKRAPDPMKIGHPAPLSALPENPVPSWSWPLKHTKTHQNPQEFMGIPGICTEMQGGTEVEGGPWKSTYSKGSRPHIWKTIVKSPQPHYFPTGPP